MGSCGLPRTLVQQSNKGRVTSERCRNAHVYVYLKYEGFRGRLPRKGSAGVGGRSEVSGRFSSCVRARGLIHMQFSLSLPHFRGGAFIIGCLVFITFVIVKAIMFIIEKSPNTHRPVDFLSSSCFSKWKSGNNSNKCPSSREWVNKLCWSGNNSNKWPSSREWLNKLCWIHTVGCYTAVEINRQIYKQKWKWYGKTDCTAVWMLSFV